MSKEVKAGEVKGNQLSVTDAIDKYFIAPIDEHLTNHEDLVGELKKHIQKLNKSKKRTLAPLAIIGELGFSCGFGMLASIFTSFLPAVPPALIIAVASALSFAIIEGGYQLIRHLVHLKPLKKEIQLYKDLYNQIITNQEQLKQLKLCVNDLTNKGIHNYSKFTTKNITGLIENTINLNKLSIQLVKNNCYSLLSDDLKAQIDKFCTQTILSDNVADIIASSDAIFKLVREEMKDKTLDQQKFNSLNLGFQMFTCLEESNELIRKTILPFNQILNTTYTKIKTNHDIEQNELFEKERKKQDRIKEEERRKYEAERKTVVNFFDEFGVDVPND